MHSLFYPAPMGNRAIIPRNLQGSRENFQQIHYSLIYPDRLGRQAERLR